MKIISFLLGVCVLSGCGSIATLSATDDNVTSNLRNIGSYCGTVPRIYSGVVYDYCSMLSDHTSRWSLVWFVPVGFYAVSMLGSAVVDTVALPYTIPAQGKNGSYHIQ